MNLVPCRDCMTPIPADAKGCPRCARNLMAERAIWKFIRLTLLLAVIIITGLLAWLLTRAAH